MCQLNLYIVPKTMKRDVVLDIMKNCFSYQEPECVTSENLLVEVQDDCDVYISAGMGCNCGTIQTSFQNEDKFDSWNDIKIDMVNREKEKMLKIKSLLERDDYLEYKNEVQAKLSDYEERLKGLKGEEYESVMQERIKYFQENQLLFETMLKYEKYKEVDGKDVVYNTIDEDLKEVVDSAQ